MLSHEEHARSLTSEHVPEVQLTKIVPEISLSHTKSHETAPRLPYHEFHPSYGRRTTDEVNPRQTDDTDRYVSGRQLLATYPRANIMSSRLIINLLLQTYKPLDTSLFHQFWCFMVYIIRYYFSLCLL